LREKVSLQKIISRNLTSLIDSHTRFIILALVNEPWIWQLLGDPLYLLKTGNLAYVALLSFGIAGASAKYVPLIVEIISNYH
jgi:hypothetical protein